jgi:hypothetical protein
LSPISAKATTPVEIQNASTNTSNSKKNARTKRALKR